MQKYTNQQYTEIFEKLPDALKDAVASSETSKKVSEIGNKHHLQVDQTGSLIEIVLDVLMGITTAKDFLEEIKRTISIESNEAISIVNDVNEEIFKPVRETMEKTFREGAPNKLRTISTIEENDDEHLHLTKHDILREIENPVEAKFRKTVEVETEEKPTEISKTTEIEEYSEELSGNKIEIRKTENPILPKVEVVPQVRSISETKLSGITSMDKGEIEVKKETKDESPKSQVDPYREQIS